MDISLAPEAVFTIGSFAVTNTVFTAFVIVFLIAVFAIYSRSKLSYRNPGKFQIALEMVIEALYDLVQNTMDKKAAKKMFGFLMTFFVLIIFSNWFGLLPTTFSVSVEKHDEHHEEVEGTTVASDEVLVAATDENQSVMEDADPAIRDEQTASECLATKHCYITTDGLKEFHESVHVFRAPTSDLSMGIALAIISVTVTNFLGFKYIGLGYIKKYLNFSGPIEGFVGLLEVVSELGKVVSFSFRLFGNIFAGEILLVVITGISFGLATLPFFLLEIFVGAIQAFVFFMLTAVFIGLALTPHEH